MIEMDPIQSCSFNVSLFLFPSTFEIIMSIFFVLLGLVLLSVSMALDCVNDSECGTNGACLFIELSDGKTKGSCTTTSATRPPCRGRTTGHCPQLGVGWEPLLCVYQTTTKLRNVKCCDVTILKQEEVPGTTTTEDTAARRLEEDDTTDDECFECFRNPGDDTKVRR